MRFAGCLFVLLAFCSTAESQITPDQMLSTVEHFKAEFDTVPCKKQERLLAVRALFERMGAKTEDVTSEKKSNVQNVIVRRTAEPPIPDTIVIGGHYDFIGGGCGAVDNWSGIVALAHLYKTIGHFKPRKNIVFVAFDREEEGLVGSRVFANAIKKEELPNYCAMINIDSFGLAGPFALTNVSSPPLVRLSEEIASKLQVPFVKVSIGNADTDSSSFLARKIPAVTLSGLSNNWESILHSKNDQADKVQPVSVYIGYRLALSLWGHIDEAPCAAFASSGK